MIKGTKHLEVVENIKFIERSIFEYDFDNYRNVIKKYKKSIENNPDCIKDIKDECRLIIDEYFTSFERVIDIYNLDKFGRKRK